MNAISRLFSLLTAFLLLSNIAFSQVGHIKKIDALTFNKDGSLLLSGSHDGVLILWNENGEKTNIMIPEQSMYNRDIKDVFTKAIFLNKGDKFIAGALSHAYWGDTNSGSLDILLFGHSIAPRGIDVSGDGQYIICNDMFSGPGIEIRYAKGGNRGEVFKTITEKGTFDVVAIENTPEKFVCSGQLSGVKVMDIRGKVYTHLPTLTGMERMAVTADGKYLMKGNMFYDLESGKKIATLDIKSSVADVDFSKDSKIITCHDKEVNIWDFSGKLLNRIQHDQLVTQATISPEGKLLVFGDEKGQLKMYTLSGQFIQDYK